MDEQPRNDKGRFGKKTKTRKHVIRVTNNEKALVEAYRKEDKK